MKFKNVIFLDIDGVINNREAYYYYHGNLAKYDTKTGLEINQDDDYLVGLFEDFESGFFGEIYNKALVKQLSEFCKKHQIQIVLVSSSSDVMNPNNLNYWNKTFGLDIIDYKACIGDLDHRLSYMYTWIDKRNRDASDAKYRGILVDDLEILNEDIEQYVNRFFIHVRGGLKDEDYQQLEIMLNEEGGYYGVF